MSEKKKSILAEAKILAISKEQDAINMLAENFNTWAVDNNISAFLAPTTNNIKGRVNWSAREEVAQYLITQLIRSLAKNIVYEDILRGIDGSSTK